MWECTVEVAAAAAKSLQLCPTLWDLIDGSPPGTPVPGILQARTLEWVANSFSKAWKWKVKVKSLSCIRLLATPWTAAYQVPPPMGFSRQEYWSGVPLPSPIYYLVINISTLESHSLFFCLCTKCWERQSCVCILLATSCPWNTGYELGLQCFLRNR